MKPYTLRGPQPESLGVDILAEKLFAAVPPGTDGSSPVTFPRHACALRNKCRVKYKKRSFRSAEGPSAAQRSELSNKRPANAEMFFSELISGIPHESRP
jgi:hypothetical protein